MKIDSERVRGLVTDRLTKSLTDICDCRVTCATEKIVFLTFELILVLCKIQQSNMKFMIELMLFLMKLSLCDWSCGGTWIDNDK